MKSRWFGLGLATLLAVSTMSLGCGSSANVQEVEAATARAEDAANRAEAAASRVEGAASRTQAAADRVERMVSRMESSSSTSGSYR